jgi:hypothetical protein
MSDPDASVRMESDGEYGVVITGIDIPFIDLVVLIMKIALATVPAAFIVGMLFSLVASIFSGGPGR